MSVVFDLVILLFLSVTGVFILHVSTHAEHRKKHPVFLVATILLIAWIVVFYGSFIEPKRLVVSEQVVSVSEQDEISLRAVVVADLHVGPYKRTRWAQHVVDRVMSLDPEIIFIPGDFIFSGSDEIQYLDPLKDLSAPHGVFAVTGNHDYTKNADRKVIAKLEELGITVLQNESKKINVAGTEIYIAGINDLWNGANVYNALRDFSDTDNIILLSHNPDVVMFTASKRADLVISGHTHGGQIRLPFIGPVPNLPTELGRAYDQGLFNYEEIQLFITSGVAETGARARLFNPPEINMLTISF